ncbi:MAG: DNA-3-methyladenine glycosylase [Armatimonadetes bacterium RBG_19FT_COMBO_69_19]|nr:MAG: DNA-3-methyladenine glycosylase [Armatimonadetes bacterium RBG_19FT_COMBO_69_19]
MAATADRIRCSWALGSALMTTYHDEEWGVPCHDDRTLFEFLILEGMQAGLSWDTVLRKRDNFRAAFDGFDPRKVARYGAADIRRLMRDEGIIRNRAKIDAAIGNAKACLQVQGEFGSFDRFIWQFVDGRPLQGRRRRLQDIPANTDDSVAMSKELRRRGFRFVGPTICYAFMQAVGLVNDHLVDCFRCRRLS